LLYNRRMFENETREFRPELISRRGETTAWALALVVSLSLFALHWVLGTIPAVAWVFWGFLLFAALSISLGNWMDRRTVIRIDPDGIAFENGLRRVRLGWPEIRKVNVLPARWGQSVQVIGDASHFEFRTLGKVEFQGEVRGRVGFAAGQEMLEHILKTSGLELVKKAEQARYYARS